MLSAEHRAIVKATVPLLESGGEALTTRFYKLLLSEHPEVRPLFNQANQANGAQPRALANSVLMYARHIDQLEQLADHQQARRTEHPARALPDRRTVPASSHPRSTRRRDRH
jgi:hemoglobin-like flavoprotein